jgi:hypothetical protein
MPRACAIGIEIGHEIGNNTRYRSFEHPIAAVLFGAGRAMERISSVRRKCGRFPRTVRA